MTPSQCVQELRFRLKLSGPVDVMAAASRLHVDVFEERLTDLDGLLLRDGDKARILVNSSTAYGTRKRFTIAHELGHFCMPHHQDEMYLCTPADLACYKSNKWVETEANQFASELILPAHEVERRLRALPDLNVIRDIAEEYGASLTATAVSVARITCESIAVVLSEHGKIKWSVKSKSFPYQVKRGKLHEWTYAHDLFHRESIPKVACPVQKGVRVLCTEDPGSSSPCSHLSRSASPLSWRAVEGALPRTSCGVLSPTHPTTARAMPFSKAASQT